MITLTVDKRQQRELERAIEGTRKKLPQEVANAVNKTASKLRTKVSVLVRQEIAISAADVKRIIKTRRRATRTNTSSVLQLDHEKRPGIGGRHKRFSPRQTRAGTSYRISKKGPRETAIGAFMGPRPGKLAPKLHGGVFVRKDLGNPRSKIRKLYGVSPWAVYIKQRMDPLVKTLGAVELRIQVDSRIRTILKNKRLS